MTHTINETVFQRVKPVLEAVQGMIESAGPQGLPSGHLYAMLTQYMDLDTYEAMITLMIKAGGITRTNHVLKATK